MSSRQSKLQEDTYFRVMKILEEHPKITQRELAAKLGLSLGGINYCITSLVKKGFIKARNFRDNNTKLKYAYLMTPKGIKEKASLTYSFLHRKMQEYDSLRLEIESIQLEIGLSNVLQDELILSGVAPKDKRLG